MRLDGAVVFGGGNKHVLVRWNGAWRVVGK